MRVQSATGEAAPIYKCPGEHLVCVQVILNTRKTYISKSICLSDCLPCLKKCPQCKVLISGLLPHLLFVFYGLFQSLFQNHFVLGSVQKSCKLRTWINGHEKGWLVFHGRLLLSEGGVAEKTKKREGKDYQRRRSLEPIGLRLKTFARTSSCSSS